MEENLPRHVVIIPDGNRRWARKRGLKPWDGHREGAERFKELLEEMVRFKIPYFSFWVMSVDNFKKRPKREIRFLINLLKELKKISKSKEIHDNKIRINVLGLWKSILPKKIIELIEGVIDKTKNYDKFFVNVFLAYNGINEMLDAIKRIKKRIIENPDLKITPDLIKQNLFTKNLPPVDYLIRTGGEPHLSAGFMMWDIANAQLYFTDTYFPDFGKEEFRKAIQEYQKRERRLGG